MIRPVGLASHLLAALGRALDAQRGHLFPWVPVCLGAGIVTWFALRFEPGAAHYAGAAAAALLLLLLARRMPASTRPLALGLALALAGGLLAGHRAHSVAGPVLGWRYYGPVEGRVVEIDRSASEKPRVTLDQVVLRDVAPDRTPHRVRLSLHGEMAGTEPVPGLRVMTTGHLSPPGGPVEPGGFDFARLAWFEGLGAVGYARVPLLVAAPPEGGALLLVTRARMALSAAIQDALPGETGAFASAVTTGDRSGLSEATAEALRDSNLAHLLSISGLHMALLSGFVFAALRLGIAAVPPLALRVPAKKVAAALAIVASTIYFALSGGTPPTERSYIMVLVMLVAVLLDRRAISVRSIAVSALILLVLRPDTLMGPSFQMSFAATLALVAVFAALREHRDRVPRLPGWAKPVTAALLTSFVAGMATAPYAAAHFNQMAHYGLLANLLSTPVMGMVVMPAAVVAAVLWPLGLAMPALWVMGLGCDWILLVGERVAALGGAVTLLPSPPTAFLPLLTLGVVFLALWRGRWRLAGAAPVALSAALWGMADRPAGLVSETGALVGWMGAEGRALSRPRGDGFAARVWLENDGDGASQEAAAARRGGEGWQTMTLPGGGGLHHLPGKSGPEGAPPLCQPGAILVLSEPWEGSGPCVVLDPPRLRDTGAVALVEAADGVRLVTARDRAGRRLWNDAEVRSLGAAPGRPGRPAAVLPNAAPR